MTNLISSLVLIWIFPINAAAGGVFQSYLEFWLEFGQEFGYNSSKLVFSKQIWQLSIFHEGHAGDVMRVRIFVEEF